MNIKNILPFVIAGIFIGIIFNLQGNKVKFEKVIYKQDFGDAPLNQKERFMWEFLRLRDPASGKIPDDIRRASLDYAMTLPGSNKNLNNKKDIIQSESWNLRGPSNIGGRTRALAFDVLDENILIAGGVSGGMWRSIDGGKNWIKTTKPEQLQSTSCLAQDIRPGKENVWYAGTGEYFNIYGGLRGDGIYKSTDGGRSWFLLTSTVSNTPHSWDNSFDYVWNIVTDHKNLNQDVVYAATAVGAIKRSTNGGVSWTTLLGGFGNDFSWFTDIAISPNGILYAALSQKTFSETASSSIKGIYRSTDGISWTEITPAFIPAQYRRIVIGISPSDENQVYFLGESPEAGKMTIDSRGDSLWHSIWKYTYVSGDGSGTGGTWEDRSNAIPNPPRRRSQFNSQGGYDLVIKVKPDDPETVFIGGTNLYRSTDGFRTPENVTLIGGYCWDDTSCYEIYTYTNHHADEHAIIFHPSNPKVMLTGSDGGIAITYDNLKLHVDWESLNTGYYTTQFYTCSIDHATPGSQEIIGGLQDNGTLYTNSSGISKPWSNANGADGFHCAIADSGKAYYVSNNASRQPFIKIWREYLDNDGLPIKKTRIDPDGAKDMIWNTPFRLDPNNSRRMYLAGGQMLWRNNNLDLIPDSESKDSTSIGWDALSFAKVDSNVANAYREEMISAVVVSKNPANIVYYGTTYGRVFRLDNANTGNPKPLNITGSKFPKIANVGCIAVDPHNAERVFAILTNFNVQSIFYSEDGGINWTHISGNLEQFQNGGGAGPACFWLEVLPVGNDFMYFAGTSTGLYSTSYLDGEYTVWQQEGAASIGNAMIYMLDSRESDGFVAASTFGVGMYSNNFTSIHSAPNPPELLYPAIDTTGILNEVVLSWKPSDNAFFYLLQVSTDENFENIFFEKDGLRETTTKIYNLEQGLVKYYWRVISRSAGGKSQNSEVRTFTTSVSPPALIYPANNATDVEIQFSFSWQESFGADSYHLQLSENALFTKFNSDTVIKKNTYGINDLKGNKRYYWRVSSINNSQEGLFSEDFSFKTKEVIGVDDAKGQSEEILLIGSYPNPFSDYSKIVFYLKTENNITIMLYDERGRKIRTIVSGVFSEGEHSIILDGHNLVSGRYFCELRINNYELRKRCILQIVKAK